MAGILGGWIELTNGALIETEIRIYNGDMRRRKKRAVGSPSPEVGEQTGIPVAGPLWLRQMGAAAYLAVLAYPGRDEWPKRDQFIEGVKARFVKEARRRGCPKQRIPQKYRSFSNRRIDQILRRTFHRLWVWRAPAGLAGNWMMVAGSRFGPYTFKVSLRRLRTATFVRSSAKYLGPETTDVTRLSPFRAMQEIVKQIDEAKGMHREELPALENARRRVWTNSLPVLHLTMPIAYRLSTEDNPMKFIYDPSWVAPALRNAECLLKLLPHKIASFNPRRALRLIAE
jgi:hypothetical protein